MPDLERDLAAATALYRRLAEQLVPGRDGVGGRRPVPASRPPLRVPVVSLMAEFERYLSWWTGEARRCLGGR